jgi:hypothetical protein
MSEALRFKGTVPLPNTASAILLRSSNAEGFCRIPRMVNAKD